MERHLRLVGTDHPHPEDDICVRCDTRRVTQHGVLCTTCRRITDAESTPDSREAL